MNIGKSFPEGRCHLNKTRVHHLHEDQFLISYVQRVHKHVVYTYITDDLLPVLQLEPTPTITAGNPHHPEAGGSPLFCPAGDAEPWAGRPCAHRPGTSFELEFHVPRELGYFHILSVRVSAGEDKLLDVLIIPYGFPVPIRD